VTGPNEPQDLPGPPDALDRPRVGVDTWVAEVEERTQALTGLLAPIQRAFGRLPLVARLAVVVVPAAFFPLVTSSDYVIQVAVLTVLYAMLALGLNIAVGFAGLLDLGYVAFFGFGAYGYAFLASDHFDLHWQAGAAIPVIVVACTIVGFLVGLPSRRLVGDYLAIVTLFFLQIFITLLNNADRINVPFVDHAVNFTRGPNGISDIDAMRFFGFELTTLDQYYWLALGAFCLVVGALSLLERSRTGRAWRALREDPLAAELMGTPVNRLKLMAFALGAAAAGLTGTIFAAQQGAVFPVDFDLVLLITLYAMVILGGVGSLAGVALGAVVITVSLEILRTPANASWIFYAALLLVVFLAVRRPWPLAVLGGVVGFGFAVRALADAVWPRGTRGSSPGEAAIDGLVEDWVLIPTNAVEIGRLSFVLLVALTLALTMLRGWPRVIALVPVLYLAVFVWQNVLLPQPSVARYVMLGAMLIALMAARPQGLLGTPRVEIA
jgi:branched-chain amino acid transport system permease protein